MIAKTKSKTKSMCNHTLQSGKVVISKNYSKTQQIWFNSSIRFSIKELESLKLRRKLFTRIEKRKNSCLKGSLMSLSKIIKILSLLKKSITFLTLVSSFSLFMGLVLWS
jgi:hypothetical protein